MFVDSESTKDIYIERYGFPKNHLLFSAFSSGFLTQEEINQIFIKFRSLKNITISDSTNTSLVSDGTSALAEVVVADKPIIYLSNGWNNEFNSNKLSRELKKYVYLAYNPNDVTRYIDYIRQNNYSSFSKSEEKSNYFKKVKCKLFELTCNRKEFKKILDPIETPCMDLPDNARKKIIYNSKKIECSHVSGL